MPRRPHHAAAGRGSPDGRRSRSLDGTLASRQRSPPARGAAGSSPNSTGGYSVGRRRLVGRRGAAPGNPPEQQKTRGENGTRVFRVVDVKRSTAPRMTQLVQVALYALQLDCI